jgi:NADPH-dependent glutamate synthase beta subunit-like oxidoreductase
MMRVGIPEYRLPHKIIDFEYKYLTMLGVRLKLGVEVGKDVSFDELVSVYDAVILAVGAHKSFIPPVKGLDTNGITNAVDFLKAVSLGEHGATVGHDVLVIGGGDVTMDCAKAKLRCLQLSMNRKVRLKRASSSNMDGALRRFSAQVAASAGWC